MIEPRASVSAKALYERYANWARESGEEPVSNKKFGELLTDRGIGRDTRGPRKTTRRLGIRLRAEDAEDAELFAGPLPYTVSQVEDVLASSASSASSADASDFNGEVPF